jgi:chemotaxis response regulator CheB
VIAPNTTLTLRGSVLHLRSRDPAEKPIALLMYSSIRSLRREPNAIGIILSGSKSDGEKGIQAVKQAGGNLRHHGLGQDWPSGATV